MKEEKLNFLENENVKNYIRKKKDFRGLCVSLSLFFSETLPKKHFGRFVFANFSSNHKNKYWEMNQMG